MRKASKKEWIKCISVIILYLAFLVWVKSIGGLLVVPFIFDAYISKYIHWSWWKTSENRIVRNVMSWVDAILFALVAVYFVHIFTFQNYQIPSSSLEKSLLVGDYLFVSKLSYGPRIPMTPLSMPLTQHTLPIVNTKSYLDQPHWDYRRVKGLGHVKRNDIVVFNYPAGDTIASNPAYQAQDYYMLCYGIGMQETSFTANLDSLSPEKQRSLFQTFYTNGRNYIQNHPEEFGAITSRPVDRRENYVKRCVGLPGDTLQSKNHILYINGVAQKEPENVQYNYNVYPTEKPITSDFLEELGISKDDRHNPIPLTHAAYEQLKSRKDLVKDLVLVPPHSSSPTEMYPHNLVTHWDRDNFGPLWIPQRGATLSLTMENIALYERPIRVYEGNELIIRDGKFYINGKETNQYTFKMDYYWMMGDNRHNSLDSRYWGFVPEDHVVGKPIVVWLSLDKDKGWFSGKIRWNRFFKFVDNIK
ncbi:MAG: S26 family signal peptidase [Bacteroidaceae bacterium]